MDDLTADEQRKMRDAAEIWKLSAEDLTQLARTASGSRNGTPNQSNGSSPLNHDHAPSDPVLSLDGGFPQDQIFASMYPSINEPGADSMAALDGFGHDVHSVLPDPIFPLDSAWCEESGPQNLMSDSNFMLIDTPSSSAKIQAPWLTAPQVLTAQVGISETNTPFVPVAEFRSDSAAEPGPESPVSGPSTFGPPPPPRRQLDHRDVAPRRPGDRNVGEAQRRQVNPRGKTKACIRCKIHRVKCALDLQRNDGCCLKCSRRTNNIRALPCLRYRITETELIDHASRPRPEWTNRWSEMKMVDIDTWASSHIREVTITQYVTGADGLPLTYQIMVRRFKPRWDDALKRTWRCNAGKGAEESYQCTPYGIANMAESAKTLTWFVDNTLLSAIHFHMPANEDNKLLRSTYEMAYKYARSAKCEEEMKLLQAVLRLWGASRMENRSDFIWVGDRDRDTLGMAPHRCQHENCPNTGRILTPPVFSAQMEIIMTAKILRPAKKQILQLLRDLMQGSQRQSWFTIYLSLFVLLHSCAMMTANNIKRARKHGIQSGYFDKSLIEELHTGAMILLAHFHHCNKNNHPFGIDWSLPDPKTREDFDGDQIEYMRELSAVLEKRGDEFRAIRRAGKVDHELYFVAQMFEVQWRP